MVSLHSAAGAPPRRSSLVDGAYEALKRAIRNNVFAPGYQGSEGEIAAQLGMSRTPVHEAIIRLQEEGLVRVLPRRGVQVCAISPEDMREIYEVMIAAMPPERRTRTADELDALNARMEEALAGEDLVAWAEADGRFHQLLVERSGNRRLARMFHTIMDQSHRARMLTLRLRPKPGRSLRDHRGIVEAIRLGEAPAARDRAKAHRARARDELLPLIDALGMRHL
jgi:DNA-binding GntR family transcriptional regulator